MFGRGCVVDGWMAGTFVLDLVWDVGEEWLGCGGGHW